MKLYWYIFCFLLTLSCVKKSQKVEVSLPEMIENPNVYLPVKQRIIEKKSTRSVQKASSYTSMKDKVLQDRLSISLDGASRRSN